MKSKLITVAMGAVMLGTGTLAMAHDWNDHDDRGRHAREWRRHEFREHHPRWHHEYYRYEPRFEHRYVPVPDWRYRSSYPQGYDRDGVSIILRGHIN